MKVKFIKILIGALGTAIKWLSKGLEDLEIRGRAETIQTTHIIEIGQNTEKGPGDLRISSVTQTPVKNRQLTLIWKTRGDNDNNNKSDMWRPPHGQERESLQNKLNLFE